MHYVAQRHFHYHWGPNRDEDGGHYEIELATGTCWRLDDPPRYSEPLITRAIDRTIPITRKTTLEITTIAGARYLVRRGEGSARHVMIPKPARVEWIAGTLLVRVDDYLLHVGNGRTIRGAGSRTSRPFVISGNRVVTRSETELVIYDRELAELVRWRPDGNTRIAELVGGDHRGVVFANDREILVLSPTGKWQHYSYSNCRWRHAFRRPGDKQ